MQYDNILTFLILSLLEVILGLDNLIFISLLVSKLPTKLQDRARLLGVSIALLMRLGVLFGVSWILSLTKPIFSLLSLDLSIHDLIMVGGGGGLMYKSLLELYHHTFNPSSEAKNSKNLKSSIISVIIQIIVIDLVFSIDSILTAIALTHNITVIALAFVTTMVFMVFLSKHVVQILTDYPQIKIIALLFIVAIGGILVLEGIHVEISKNYVYFAFFFSLLIEFLHIIRTRRKA